MIKQSDRHIILASASPRRRALLQELGLNFDIIPAHIEEKILENEIPLEHVRRLAYEKGKAIAAQYPESIVIASDTIVILDDDILGKPNAETQAESMLKSLSGRSHEVVTAFSIQCVEKKISTIEHEITEVHFRELSDEDIKDYIASGSPMDKAGAYGIQDLDAYLVDRINGCYQNVVGFPVAKFARVWNNIIK